MYDEYNATSNAIKHYYTNGEDRWKEFDRYNLSSETASEVLEEVPEVTAVKSKSGKVIDWVYDTTVRDTNDVTDTITDINSNVTPQKYTTKIPAIMSESVETGKLSSVSGVGYKASTGTNVKGVLSTISAAVGAVCVGATLGKTIDSVLYNLNPDFWDENGMASLNPDTWEAFASDSAGGTVLNALLGLDSDTNDTQMYIDEKAFAYYALYLNNNGVFDSPTTKITTWVKGMPDELKDLIGSISVQSPFSFPISKQDGKDPRMETMTKGAGDVGVFTVPEIINRVQYVGYRVDGARVPVRMVAYSPNESDDTPYQFTFNDKTVYWGALTWYGFSIASYYIDNSAGFNSASLQIINNFFTANYAGLIAWMFLYGSETYTGVEGISTQDGATVPDLSDIKEVDDALKALELQYPDLWKNAITKSVLQPDGSYEELTYIPVVSTWGGTATQPLTGTATQAAPAINPTTATATELGQAANLLAHQQTASDLNNASQMGNGSSPSLVVPVGSASALYKVYNPTQEQLNGFGGWLWSSDFVDQLLKLFNDPMQAIIGLHKVFSPVPVGGTDVIKVGYLSSGVSSNWVNEQYVTIDCGSVNVSEYFNNILDYEPYTQIYIYLPFIGIETLKVGDVMRSTVNVVYHCDVLTGACLAEIHCIRDGNNVIMYTFSGNCAVQYPISSGSYMGIVSSITSVVGGAVGTIASGGSMLPVAMSGIDATMNAHANVSHSGGFSGNSGAMGVKKPYLIINRTQSIIPNDVKTLAGLSANNSTTLNNCSGVIKVERVNLSNITATIQEKDMIESLLKEGAII